MDWSSRVVEMGEGQFLEEFSWKKFLGYFIWLDLLGVLGQVKTWIDIENSKKK